MSPQDKQIDRRRAVLETVRNAGGPISVDDIAEQCGIHPNTARTHLDVLMAGGELRRTQAEAAGRGRPKWLYTAVERTAHEGLLGALTAHLALIGDSVSASEAARLWAATIPNTGPVDSIDAAVEMAADSLRSLGFQAEPTDLGEAVTVRGCPYATLAKESPVICDIHTALVARILEASGQQVRLATMDVWATADTCVARLIRQDRVPARTIDASTLNLPADKSAS